MSPLERVGLSALMGRTQGGADTTVMLIDGSVLLDHPDLAGVIIREAPREGLKEHARY
jgi:hypothetical protein